MLEKIKVIDSINVTEVGILEIRTATKIMEDSVELSKSYHRHCLAPADDISGEDVKTQAIASAVWTPEVVEAYESMLASAASAPITES